jgi:hypothetical protein
MALDHHVSGRSLFRMVRPATGLPVSGLCHRGRLCAICFAYLQHPFCGADLEKLAVSRVSCLVLGNFTYCDSLPDLRARDTCHHERRLEESFRPPPPTFLFLPSTFVPANTKARLVFKLRDSATAHETLPLQQHAATAESSSRLTQAFFKSGVEEDADRARLIEEPHFVLYNKELRSLRLPSVAINIPAREVSLDWRRLCAVLMRDDFRCRFEANSPVAWWRTFG